MYLCCSCQRFLGSEFVLTYLGGVKYVGPCSLLYIPSGMYPLPHHRYQGCYAQVQPLRCHSRQVPSQRAYRRSCTFLDLGDVILGCGNGCDRSCDVTACSILWKSINTDLGFSNMARFIVYIIFVYIPWLCWASSWKDPNWLSSLLSF